MRLCEIQQEIRNEKAPLVYHAWHYGAGLCLGRTRNPPAMRPTPTKARACIAATPAASGPATTAGKRGGYSMKLLIDKQPLEIHGCDLGRCHALMDALTSSGDKYTVGPILPAG